MPITAAAMKTPRKTPRHAQTAREYMGFVEIGVLPHNLLTRPLGAILESDDDGFIVRTIDLPLYGASADPVEAIENLKIEIETLHAELMEDDRFSQEWLNYKRFLQERIIPAR